jgi:hypothetical protein
MAGCGHIVYSWRDVDRCPNCHEPTDPADESLREFRRRLKERGLLS